MGGDDQQLAQRRKETQQKTQQPNMEKSQHITYVRNQQAAASASGLKLMSFIQHWAADRRRTGAGAATALCE